MFPFRPSRAATALLEVAEAMLAPLPAHEASAAKLSRDPARHPHRRTAEIERRRRPGASTRPQACLTPLTRTARTLGPSTAAARMAAPR